MEAEYRLPSWWPPPERLPCIRQRCPVTTEEFKAAINEQVALHERFGQYISQPRCGFSSACCHEHNIAGGRPGRGRCRREARSTGV